MSNGIDNFVRGLSVVGPSLLFIVIVFLVLFVVIVLPAQRRDKQNQKHIKDLCANEVLDPSLEKKVRTIDKKLGYQITGFVIFLMFLLFVALGAWTLHTGQRLILLANAGLIVLLIIGIVHTKLMSKKFYKQWLPDLLENLFADYQPKSMETRDKSFFSAPLHYESGEAVTFGTLNKETSDYRSDGFFCVNRIFHQRNYNKENSRDSYYEIRQTLVLNVFRTKSVPLNCNILVDKEADKSIVGGLLHGAFSMIGDAVNHSIGPNGMSHVTLENPEFERYFEVSSNDQIASRMFLTPVQMQRLEELHRLVGNFRVYYTDEKITVIFLDFDMMDTDGCYANGFPKCLRVDTIKNCQRILNLIFENLTLLWEE